MGVYDRILVPLDGSAVDDVVLDHIERLAAECGAEVVLLRVAHYHTRDERAHEVEDARECLGGAEARLRGKSFAVRTVVADGEPAETIVEQAEAVGADLIAMATHGHGTLPRLFLGSVADKVRHASPVPLLLIKARRESGK
jgi:nucleotide-binding universal stress UspA family protein